MKAKPEAGPGELFNCFSIYLVSRYINFEKIIDTPQLHRNFQNNLINLILYGRASVHHHEQTTVE